MKAVDILMDEHQVILNVLNSLERYNNAITSNSDYKIADLKDYVTFFKNFADAFHHMKEEDILFIEMGNNGFPANAGPIAVMLNEHNIRRNYVEILDNNSKLEKWSLTEKEKVVKTGNEFIILLKGHIHKEDNILFPMANNVLPENAQAEVNNKFSDFESDAENSKTKLELIELAKNLANKY